MDHGTNVDNNRRKEYVAKVVLISVFLGSLVSFLAYMTIFGPGLSAFKLGTMDLVLLALATYRLGRLIAYDRVMEPVRQFFTETHPDSTGAGDTVDPKGTGFQNALGQLICCPICSGTWVAASLVYGLYLFPDAMRVFLTMTAAIGAAEILNALTEAWTWSGQYHRVLSGQPNLERQEREQAAQAAQQKTNALARVDHRTAPLAAPLGDAGFATECPEDEQIIQAQQQKARQMNPVDWQKQR